MFDELKRTLKNLSGQRLALSINSDEDGYIDRECPAANCLFQFKAHLDDWKNLFKDEVIYCPMCRHEAPSGNWATTRQVEQAKEQARKFITFQMGKAMRRDADGFNASQSRNSLIKMSMAVNGFNNYFFNKPISAMEEMALKITCENCGARFAVIGSAFFCPCCGNNSAEQTIDASLNKVEVKLNNLDLIKKTLVEQITKDEAEIIVRSLLESCLGDCVVAFQRYCEEVFTRKFPRIILRQNTFQRLDDGSKIWVAAVGEGYSDWLDAREIDRFSIYFQQRHLFAHKEGIVDATYISKTSDTTYKEGQRIVVKESEAREFLSLIRKLVNSIRAKI